MFAVYLTAVWTVLCLVAYGLGFWVIILLTPVVASVGLFLIWKNRNKPPEVFAIDIEMQAERERYKFNKKGVSNLYENDADREV